MRLRRGWRSQMEQGRSEGTMRRHAHRGVLHVLRQGHELLAQCVCRLQLGTYLIIIPQSTQHGEKPLWVFKMCTDLASRRVCLSNLTGCVAFHSKQRSSQGNQQVY